MNKTIILIGPIAVGKSTVGKMLSEKLNLPNISMDELRFSYYREIGYDEEYAKHKRETEGLWSLLFYWKPFEAHAVERILEDQKDCIIDLGAGHSVYEDNELFARVQQALRPYSNVILLLPSPDADESVAILNEREEFLRAVQPNVNEHFIKHHSNYDLAKFIVYTKAKSPEETCAEILDLVSSSCTVIS